MSKPALRIGGASGFWGDSARATRQLLEAHHRGEHPLDFIVYDYLAEITMSILARARERNEKLGYAASFLAEAMVPNLALIKDSGIRIVSNAGGVNPAGCAEALEKALQEERIDLKVAWVGGDDLTYRAQDYKDEAVKEMFSGADFPDLDHVLSVNAYLGAFPIAAALDTGADIVITGRSVDSAVTLGACLHYFGWTSDHLDRLAMGSLAGHILECGPQATGGNFTDWEQAGDLSLIGYPISIIEEDGSFECTKPTGTSGLVNIGTVAEQMLYEIGDPKAYLLPDVTCDFSQVKLTDLGEDRVRVEGAKGAAPTETYKVSATYFDQFRGGMYSTFYGGDAERKARHFADCVLAAARRALTEYGMPGFSEVSLELIGAESQFGSFRKDEAFRELVLKLAVKHPMKVGVEILFKEAVGLGLATPPGLSSFSGNRSKASPVVRLFSFLAPKSDLSISINMDGVSVPFRPQSQSHGKDVTTTAESVEEPKLADAAETTGASGTNTSAEVQLPADAIEVPLIKLAWCRSGDKGDKVNVGVIARRPEYFPYIDRALTKDAVRQRFMHFLGATTKDANPVCGITAASVDKYHLPGVQALNFLLHDTLGGGGVASLRNDPQGKGYSQLLLECMIRLPKELAEDIA